MVFVLAVIFLFLPLTILFPTKVLHKKRMPKGKKCIVSCNHYSNLDPLIIDAKFFRKFNYLAKVELFKNRFFGCILKSLGSISVDREKVSPSVYKEVLKRLNKNKQIFIFPEGTRNKSGDETLGDIKTGIITFASKGDAEIVPMIMHHKPKLFRKNYIIVGEPFKVEGENPKRLTKQELDINLAKYTKVMNDLRKEVDDFVNSKNKKRNSDKVKCEIKSKSLNF